MQLTHLSLFSGIGGLDLAAEWAGIKTVGQCEWAEYPTKVLEKHWPDVPRWKDIRTLTGESFYERTGRRTVDIISGGFPCQPFSVAGKRRGAEDDRFLWPEMVRVIKELRPTWIIGENVAGIVRMELANILSELDSEGYRTRTFLVPACAVGARHRRYRVAIVGYAKHNGSSAAAVTGGFAETGRGQQERKEKAGESARTGGSGNCKDVADSQSGKDRGLQQRGIQPDTGTSCENIQDSDRAGCKELYAAKKPNKEKFSGWGCDERDVCNAAGKRLSDGTGESVGRRRTQEPESERPDSDVPDADNGSWAVWRDWKLSADEKTRGERDHIGRGSEDHEQREWRQPESGLGGMADGLPGWVDGYWDVEPDIPRIASGVTNRVGRLKALGNAVVPQQFYQFFKAISVVEMAMI